MAVRYRGGGEGSFWGRSRFQRGRTVGTRFTLFFPFWSSLEGTECGRKDGHSVVFVEDRKIEQLLRPFDMRFCASGEVLRERRGRPTGANGTLQWLSDIAEGGMGFLEGEQHSAEAD